jgi:hypothetical protein
MPEEEQPALAFLEYPAPLWDDVPDAQSYDEHDGYRPDEFRSEALPEH